MADAEQGRFDGQIAAAWHVAAFTAAAKAGKLKPLKHYLRKQPAVARTGDEMLDAFRELQSRGAAMTIRKVKG